MLDEAISTKKSFGPNQADTDIFKSCAGGEFKQIN